jgi:hypothetical protein
VLISGANFCGVAVRSHSRPSVTSLLSRGMSPIEFHGAATADAARSCRIGFATTPIRLAGRNIQPTPVFEAYWRFAAERQRAYYRRLAGEPSPWTDDPVIREHRFTNAFRAADRVSQYLIGEVLYRGAQDPEEIVFRTLLYKLFNKIETWELLRSAVGVPTWEDFEFDSYARVLTAASRNGVTLYSAAYVIPPPRLGEGSKAENHLRLVEMMMEGGLVESVVRARCLADIYRALTSYPSVGRFIGFQIAVDLNYSSLLQFGEMDFVVAGPGALDGIRKCFGDASIGIEEELIRYVADHQDEYFAALDLQFEGLFGRPLQLVDCQNLFCEVDKYARVTHPDVPGISGRQRIKQRFRPRPDQTTAWFPPKWGLDTSRVRSDDGSRA